MWILQFLGGLLFFCSLLTGWALLTNMPVIAALVLFRRKVTPSLARVLPAIGFGISTIWLGWYLDYSDIWRQGVPPFTYILQAYVSYALVIGAVGWMAGAALVPKEKPRAALPARGRT